MFNIKSITEIDFEKYRDYKLCYIDEIPKTILDYRPEIREKYKDVLELPYEEWKEVQWKYPECRMEDLPNKEYMKGYAEYYAYFTPLELNVQWGDDWNDAPYEYNAEIPYDDVIDEVETKDGFRVVAKSHEIEILQVPFAIRSYDYKFPSDYQSSGNSHFSVEDINSGAVAWIYDKAYSDGVSVPVAIHAGCNPKHFADALEKIANNHPNFEIYDDKNKKYYAVK